MIINQWVPAAHKGDAIGDSARRVRGMLRAAGHTSDLFALLADYGKPVKIHNEGADWDTALGAIARRRDPARRLGDGHGRRTQVAVPVDRPP